MADFKRMVSMVRTAEEKAKEAMDSMPAAFTAGDVPDVPYGLRIQLGDDELKKLDLPKDCQVGDILHFVAMARVTSVSVNSDGSGDKTRIELSITDMSVEDESTEGEEAEEAAEPEEKAEAPDKKGVLGAGARMKGMNYRGKKEK